MWPLPQPATIKLDARTRVQSRCMYDKYIHTKACSTRKLIQYVALSGAVLIIGIRFALAPLSMHRQFDGSAMVLFGVGALAAGDKWGLTRSRHVLARAAGWIIAGAFATALIIGGCLEFLGK